MQTIKRNRTETLKRALFFALAAISIGLTAVFFARHLRFDALDAIHPLLGVGASIGLGLLAADVGALAWRAIYLSACRTAPQVLIAQLMIGITLTLASVTTVMSIAEAYSGAALVPGNWSAWVGWLIVLTVGVEFIAGAFLFGLFDPETRLQREIMAALVDDAESTAQAVQAEMQRGRDARVRRLAAQLAAHADGMIYDALAVNPREARLLAQHTGAPDSADTGQPGRADGTLQPQAVPVPLRENGRRP